jgi:predicted metallopeptidase
MFLFIIVAGRIKMGINYELAEDIQKRVNEIAELLFPHVMLDSVVCIRSFGSSSRGTIARCHALGKAMQIALGRKGFYVIEVISKRFDKMPFEEQTRTLIHELMHIPKSFGGGFIHHNIVHEGNVERMYQHYCNLKKRENFIQDEELINEDLNKGQEIEREFFIIPKKRRFWF